jgi:two-component system sensor histidine kinase AlgZ
MTTAATPHDATPAPYPDAASERGFRSLQMAGWAACVAVSALGTLPNLDYPSYVLYRAVVTLACLLCTLPLMALCRHLWRRASIARTALAVALSAYALAYACAVVAEGLMRAFAAAGAPPAASVWFAALTGAIAPWALLCAWAVLYFGYRYHWAERAAGERLATATALAREAELRALHYQIQPHFMFNTLNAISTLVYTRRNDDATRMLARFGDFLRMTLDADASREVRVAEELQLTLAYLEIERVRLGDRLQLRQAVDATALDLAVPPLLLQPLVENAIRHGIAPQEAAAVLEIGVTCSAGRLCLRVRNDGIDLSPAFDAGHYGVGLANIAARLRVLYGEDCSLTLHRPSSGGCEAVVDLPARSWTGGA